jgi:tetratricopeptide (TPR) repeat protein
MHRLRIIQAAIFLASVVFTNTATAQKKSVRDSLLIIVTDPATVDTTRINAEIALADYYRFINKDTSLLLVDEGISKAHQLKFNKGEGYGYNIKGLLSKDQSKSEEAIKYFNSSIALFAEVGDSLKAANVYNNIGLTWFDVSNKIEAEKSFSTALRIFTRYNNLKGIGITYVNFGQLSRKLGLYFAALDYYFMALAIFENNPVSEEYLGNTYGNIGTTYNHLEKYSEAIVYQEKALKVFEKLNLPLKVNIVKTNTANMYLEIGRLEEAEKNARETIEYFKANKRPRIVIANQIILIQVAIKRKAFEEAIAIANEALELEKNVVDPEQKITLLTNLAEINFLRKAYREAKQFAEKAVTLSIEHHLLEGEKDATQQLAEILSATGNYKEAYNAFARYTTLKDSTFNKQKLSQLFELEKKYEVDKKQSEVDLLESKNRIAVIELGSEKRSRVQLIIGAALLLILATVIFIAYRTKARLNTRLEKQNILIGSINNDLQARALRAQMNPHFIFNSLSSIQYLIIKNKTESAFDYLSQFASLLRMVMDNSEKNWISLSEEIKVLELYLELEKLRFSNSFSYSIVSAAGLENIKIPPLLIQPYVENAILHGLLPKEDDRSLTITFSGDGALILCEVADNGIGRTAAGKIAREKNRIFVSKGMNYSEERMMVLNAITDGQSKVEILDLMIDNRAAGTKVKITINQP